MRRIIVLVAAAGLLFSLVGGVSAKHPTGLAWDPVNDWRDFPKQMNPSPDAYGNQGVWRYMGAPSQVHDPSSYYLLPVYQAATTDPNSLNVWLDPDYLWLLISHVKSAIGFLPLPPTDATQKGLWPAIGMHPGGERMSVLAWTSPVSATVSLVGRARLVDAECYAVGTGVTLWIDQGTETLYEANLAPVGGETSFDFQTPVTAGETLYFILDMGQDGSCDTTHVQLGIATT